MTSTIEYLIQNNYFEATKSESTDDEYCCEDTVQNTCKTNLCKYKTEMCKNFSEMGYCPYRMKCQFAHGFEEISGFISRDYKKAYRTKKCKSFWEEGVCRYGFRCQFQHYEPAKAEQTQFLQNACDLICTPKFQGKSRLITLIRNPRN